MVLKPLKNTMAPTKSTRIEKGLRQLTAIAAISFQGAVPTINAEFMSNWLGNQVPDGVANIKVRAIDMPGCSLVGFVKSRNLIGQL